MPEAPTQQPPSRGSFAGPWLGAGWVRARSFGATRGWLLLAGLALVIGAGWVAHALAWQRGLRALAQEAEHRLAISATAVDAQLARFDFLPSVLETTPAVSRLLQSPQSPALRDETNRLLRALNATAGADMLYVLDRQGLTIAAADWDQQGTPLGMNLGFRPYVREALQQGRGRFYGVGVTSGLAGYYLSYAITRDGQTLGLATAKVSLAAQERGWAQLPGQMLLLDERGVVILSSQPAWRYRPLQPLAPSALREVALSRPYGASDLKPIDWRRQGPVGQMDAAHELLSIDGRSYLGSSRLLHQGQWRLVALDDLAPLRAEAWQQSMIGALAVLAALLLAGLLWQRRRAMRQRLRAAAALQAAHDQLEAKVVERTTELSRSLEQLADEVEARKRSEADLRATQAEMAQASKMAALGQMSAGMMHELNQPLAAMRTLADNARLLLEQQRLPEVGQNLHRLTQLVERLSKISAQLRVFAYKPGHSTLDPVRLAAVLSQAQFIVAERLREAGVSLRVDIDPPTLAVRADEARLEQVLVNLLANAIDAIDAMAGRGGAGASPEPREVNVIARDSTLEQGDGQVRIEVRDHGPGIAPEILEHLFEPFTTSKPAGRGLGLGLVISSHIAREFGGSLRGENAPEGGARFVLTLPRA